MFVDFKRFICMAFLVLISGGLSAQENSLLDKVYAKMSSSCMEIDYKYSVSVSGTKNIGDGNLYLQGHLWRMNGNGLEMFCDSSSVWVIDPVAKETVIEPVSSDISTFTNPAVIFAHLNDMFEVQSSVISDDGKSVVYILSPIAVDDVEYINVEINKADLQITSAVIAMNDGSIINIEVSSMVPTSICPISFFRPQMTFDSSWIVTDLR